MKAKNSVMAMNKYCPEKIVHSIAQSKRLESGSLDALVESLLSEMQNLDISLNIAIIPNKNGRVQYRAYAIFDKGAKMRFKTGCCLPENLMERMIIGIKHSFGHAVSKLTGELRSKERYEN